MGRPKVPMIGLKFGKLTVISEAEGRSANGGYRYICRCDCGNEVIVDGEDLRKGNTQTCTHCLDNMIIGKRFGSLVITKILGRPNGILKVECKCDCGNISTPRYNALQQGATKSCGKCRERTMIGKRYGALTIVDYVGVSKENRQFLCHCDCGNDIIIPIDPLLRGHTKSCGCIMSGLEQECINYFVANNIDFDSHVRFDDLVNEKGNKLSYDFRVGNFLIECQGKQHYEPINFFGGVEKFYTQQYHDQLKRDYARTNGFTLVEIKYDENISEVLDKIFCNKMDK